MTKWCCQETILVCDVGRLQFAASNCFFEYLNLEGSLFGGLQRPKLCKIVDFNVP